MVECPREIVDMGPDSAAEWYWRMNKPLLLDGREEGDGEVEEHAKSDGSADMDFSG
jgi:hypothetical protein